MSQPDLWDDAGPFHYRILPEDSLDAFFTEEHDMLTITNDMGKWWLGETRVAGQASYDTVEQAKASGDAQIAELEAKQDDVLLKEAGLDPTQWRISYRDGLKFERIDGTAEIHANEGAQHQSWTVFAGSDEPIATDMRSIAAALATMPA